jgi:uncharacterized membrane protein YbjE (DUF340 family)
MTETEKDQNVKEEFCGACLAIPLALAGAGAGSVGSNKRGKHKKMRKTMMIIGVITVVISIILGVYYLWIKDCSDCA